MSIFDMDEERLMNTLHDAYIRSNYDLNKAEADPDFQLAMEMYVDQHEGKDFDDALIIAENGDLPEDD